jgi:hypothetical protein
LRHGDVLSPLIFNFALEYPIRKVQEKQEGVSLNGTHQFLVDDDDDDIQKENMNIINENTKALVETSKNVRLEANTERTKYMFMSLHQNSGQNHNLVTANKLFKMWHSSSTWEQQ